jgi:hypothetical protein
LQSWVADGTRTRNNQNHNLKIHLANELLPTSMCDS